MDLPPRIDTAPEALGPRAGGAMSPPFTEPSITPMATPRAMVHDGPLPYGEQSHDTMLPSQSDLIARTHLWLDGRRG